MYLNCFSWLPTFWSQTEVVLAWSWMTCILPVCLTFYFLFHLDCSSQKRLVLKMRQLPLHVVFVLNARFLPQYFIWIFSSGRFSEKSSPSMFLNKNPESRATTMLFIFTPLLPFWHLCADLFSPSALDCKLCVMGHLCVQSCSTEAVT